MSTNQWVIWTIIVLMITNSATYVFVMTWLGLQDLFALRAEAKLEAKRKARSAYRAAKAIRTAKLFS